MKRIIETDKAPKAIGPYSQAVMAGDFLFLSGQLGLDPATMKLKGESAVEQAAQVFVNIKAILAAAGLDLASVVKVTVLLKDMNDFAAVNKVYGEYFGSDFPARAAYQVAALPMNARIEIEATAHRG